MIAIIDYNAGNLTSVKRALDFIGVSSLITSDFKKILDADRVIFPGVGAAGKAISDLKANRLDIALKEVFESGKPVLGICLGTQIILESSQENNTRCLSLVKGDVLKFPDDLKDTEGRKLKVPHMGWNSIKLKKPHPLFDGVAEDIEFYFVHSYYATGCGDAVIAATEYGALLTAAVADGNVFGTQFHPEKSGDVGLDILRAFCQL